MTLTNASDMLLPAEAYTARKWFDREQRELFGRSWQFAGMTSDASEPGEYICVQAGACPLIVIRDDEGDLKAYHNIYRHRGTQLLEVTGERKKVIKCPYHDWVYSLDGKLIGVPQKRGDWHRAYRHLRPANTRVSALSRSDAQ